MLTLMVKLHGISFYARVDSPVSAHKKAMFAEIIAGNVDVRVLGTDTLAGEMIQTVLTKAPGNNANIGGIKVVSKNAWFAARPSGTEALFKIYGESFVSQIHLDEVLSQAQKMIDKMLT